MLEDFTFPMWAVYALIAAFGAWVSVYVHLRAAHRTATAPLVKLLADAVAALNNAPTSRDAFSILERSFSDHRVAFIVALAGAGWWRRWRLRKAWLRYYGPDDDSDGYYRASEYSPLLSNEMGKTNESTRSVAIHRINSLIHACS